MSKTKELIHLDFALIKPYLTLKNMIIFLVATVAVSYSTSMPVVTSSVLMFFCNIYLSYIFAVMDRDQSDKLYSTLPISRDSVVKARYLFAIILNIFALVFSFAISFILAVILRQPFVFAEYALSTGIVFLLIVFVESFQIPVFFKLGYNKAKAISYLPFLIIILLPLGAQLLSRLSNDSSDYTHALSRFLYGVIDNWVLSLIALLLICAVILFISLKLSIKFYRQRDF